MSTPSAVTRPPAEEQAALARTIEAGVLAEHLLATGERPLPATEAELRALVAFGQEAFQQFLLGYVRLVGKLAAAEAKRSGLATEDLFQEGFLAMAEALRRYDHRRGRFSTYATVRISQHLAEVGAARLGALALPAGRALRLRRVRGLAAALGQEQQRTVGAAEVAAALGASTADVARLLGYLAPAAVDAAEEVIADPHPVDLDAGIYAEQVRRQLGRLEPDQAGVLGLRYGLVTGEPQTVGAVARQLGLSTSTVRRLEARGLAALRGAASLDPSAETPLAG